MSGDAYLKGLEKVVLLEGDKRVLLRPVRPTDLEALIEFFKRLSKESIYNRWMTVKNYLPEEEAREYVKVDFEKDMAIYAFSDDGVLRGAVRVMGDYGGKTAEFAIVIEDEWQKRGLGHIMMEYIIGIAQDKGYKVVYGEIFKENTIMTRVCKDLGFDISPIDSVTIHAVKKL